MNKKEKKEFDRAAKDSIMLFLVETTYQDKTDRELRLIIGRLREMLLKRQQRRATIKLEQKYAKKRETS